MFGAIGVNLACRSSDPAALQAAWGSAGRRSTTCACLQVFKLGEVNRVLTWEFHLKRILLVGLFMALMLLCGNLVYLYLTVSFIQMLKVRGINPHADKRPILFCARFLASL